MLAAESILHGRTLQVSSVVVTLAGLAAIAAYLLAMALEEIDVRGLVGMISERRFYRVAMSIGDGLICVDRAGHIRVNSKHELRERIIAGIADVNRHPVIHTWSYKLTKVA